MCFTHTFWPQDQLPDYRGSLLGLVGLSTRGLALQFRLLVSFFIFHSLTLWTGPLFLLEGGGWAIFKPKKTKSFLLLYFNFLCKIIIAQAMRIIDNPITIATNDRTPEYLTGVFKPSSADY